MRILFLSYWFPYPPSNGSRIRIFNFIKALSVKHDVYLISQLQRDSSPSNAEALSNFCKVILLYPETVRKRNSLRLYFGFLSNRPRSIYAKHDPVFQKKVKDAIAEIEPECIVVSTVDVVEYILGEASSPIVFIDHNCEFGVLKRAADLSDNTLQKIRLSMSWKKFARWEADIIRRLDCTIMPTQEDKQRMLDFAPDLANIVVIPNAADTEYFDPKKWSPDSHLLVYNGALTYKANLDAVLYYSREIYPILVKKYPNIILKVTGRYDNVDVSELLACPGIDLTGYINDIRDILYRSAICIVPLRHGGGMRLKIPEAMAAGVPVVTSTMGAEGLEYSAGEHLLLADSPQEFADAIDNLLADRKLTEVIRANGRKLIEEKYSWNIVSKRFISVVESTIRGKLS